MKQYIKILALAVVMFTAGNVFSQSTKFGHINFSELYSLMPGQDTVQAKYQAYANDLKNTLDAMQAELENKYVDYQNNVATYSAIIKKTKEQEIQDLQGRIEAFQMSAQQDLQAKEEELTAPIIERAREAIEAVAKEGSYTYIFNSTEGILLFSDNGDDIMPKVKTKLGLE